MIPRRALQAGVVALAVAAVIGIPVPAGATQPKSAHGAVIADSASAPAARPGITSRGGRADRGRGSAERGQAEPPDDQAQPADDCPTEMWTLPIELKGVLCVLILEKHEEDPAGGGSQ